MAQRTLTEGFSAKKQLYIFFVLSALMSFASISTDLYLPAMPTMGRELSGFLSIELTVSGFLIGFSIGQLIWGPLSDRYGRKIPVAIGMVLYFIGSAGCALSQTTVQIICWRVVQALGACVGPVLARAMVSDLYERSEAAAKLSILIMIMAIAPLIGPLLGGQILLYGSWRFIFWLLAAVGLVMLASLSGLPETLPRTKRLTTPLSSSMKDYLELVRDPRMMALSFAVFFYYIGMYGYITGSPFVYIEYYNVLPQHYGYLFGINVIGIVLCNFINNRVVRKLGAAKMFYIGLAIQAFSAAALLINSRSGFGALPGLVIPLAIYFSVNGFIVPNAIAQTLAMHPEKAGAVSALTGALQYGAGIFSGILVSSFFSGTPWTMGWVIGLSGFAALIAGNSIKIRSGKGNI